jgi:catechol 2,3-dioxygenase-like lactoylglutathione lyase family enzyme
MASDTEEREMTAFILHVTFDCRDPERMATFWAGATGYERMDVSNDEVVALHAPDSRGVRRLLFFRVPEPKTAKNRVHLDLAAKDPGAEIDRLVELGATRVEYREGNGTGWTVMLDPEGNEFCIA